MVDVPQHATLQGKKDFCERISKACSYILSTVSSYNKRYCDRIHSLKLQTTLYYAPICLVHD